MSRSIRNLFAWLAVLSCIANVTAYAGGVVICADRGDGAAIEIGCDHGHCGASDARPAHHDDHHGPDPGHHDHVEAPLCGCIACPCEDVPLAVETPRNSRNDENDADLLVPLRSAAVPPALVAAPPAPSAALESRPLVSAEARVLRSLRTVVLLV